MELLIKHIYSYGSSEEEDIKESAKHASQIMLIKGKEGEDATIKVIMVIDDEEK